ASFPKQAREYSGPKLLASDENSSPKRLDCKVPAVPPYAVPMTPRGGLREASAGASGRLAGTRGLARSCVVAASVALVSTVSSSASADPMSTSPEQAYDQGEVPNPRAVGMGGAL